MINRQFTETKTKIYLLKQYILLLLILCIISLSCNILNPPQSFIITAEINPDGHINPAGRVLVNELDDQMFTIYPGPDYRTIEVFVDNSSIGTATSYTFANVTANHTISATFELKYDKIPATDSNILYTGRYYFNDSSNAVFAWPGFSITTRFEGTSCGFRMHQHPVENLAINNRYNTNYYNVFIDGNELDTIIKVQAGDSLFVVARDLDPGEHIITIYKRTEALIGSGEFLGFYLEEGKTLLQPPLRPQRRIEFIGNSITCGYGNEQESSERFTSEKENSYLAYSAITARNLNAEYFLTSYSGIGIHLNSDSSTINTLPNIYHRVCPFDITTQWDFSSWKPHAVVINLGTNDFGTHGGIPDSLSFISAYENLILRIDTLYPGVTFFCINGPMTGYPVINDSGEQITSLNVLQNYVSKTVENVKAEGIEKIYTFSLSPLDSPEEYGAEGHPNVYLHTLNATELTAFIREKMNW